MKTTFIKKYKKYYDEVVEYSVAVHRKFASHNLFLFALYGLGLNIIDIENKILSCTMCFAISAISLTVFVISTRNILKRKRLCTFIYNTISVYDELFSRLYSEPKFGKYVSNSK